MVQRYLLYIYWLANKQWCVHLGVVFCSVLCFVNTAQCAEGMKINDRPVPTREELRLEMRPLTGDELEKEAVAWQSRVQKKVAELNTA